MKKKSNLYAVGFRVAYVGDMEEGYGSEGPCEPYYGVITALTTDDRLVVLWDDEYYQAHNQAPVSVDESCY